MGAEYFLHLLPRGSHKYKRLIRPQELSKWANENGFHLERVSSLMYNPFSRRFTLAEGKADVNYMVELIKE